MIAVACVYLGLLLCFTSHMDANLLDITLGVEEYIVDKGYECETHEIQTEDGYIISVHRIPRGVRDTRNKSRLPVLLMPALFSSSANFLLIGADKGLAFVLADHGYDVWIGNARGSTYGRRHANLDPDRDKEFWDFSFHEIGYFDVAAIIDNILSKTLQEKLYYIGHSQGTTVFFILASTRPEYNDKIRLAIQLAPVAYMANVQHPLIQFFTWNKKLIQFLAQITNIYEVAPQMHLTTFLGQMFCNDRAATQILCEELMYFLIGRNEKQMNATLLPVIASFVPAGASLKQLMHFAQEVLSEEFRQYDYGYFGNFLKYGSHMPPDYQLGKIAAPVALFHARNDLFAAKKDVMKLKGILPNVVHFQLASDEDFTHTDFIWAIEVNEIINVHIVELLGQY